MDEVRVYGASDDLIEIEGGGLREEFPLPDGDEAFVCASTGDLFLLTFGAYGWRVSMIRTVTAQLNRDEGDGQDEYVVLPADTEWVAITTYAPVVRTHI